MLTSTDILKKKKKRVNIKIPYLHLRISRTHNFANYETRWEPQQKKKNSGREGQFFKRHEWTLLGNNLTLRRPAEKLRKRKKKEK